jgi:hypothetical protein
VIKIALSIYELEDGEEINRQYPNTFEIPTLGERKSLRPGDYAKIIFKPARGFPERMWVKVVERTDPGYTGTLSNTPAFMPGDMGHIVTFEPKHIIDIMEGTDDGQ